MMCEKPHKKSGTSKTTLKFFKWNIKELRSDTLAHFTANCSCVEITFTVASV